MEWAIKQKDASKTWRTFIFPDLFADPVSMDPNLKLSWSRLGCQELDEEIGHRTFASTQMVLPWIQHYIELFDSLSSIFGSITDDVL